MKKKKKPPMRANLSHEIFEITVSTIDLTVPVGL